MRANHEETLLSVIVPCYNEQEVIAETHRRLTEVLSGLDCDYEIIYIDDGSRDTTAELLRGLHAADDRVRVLLLARNFGHQRAVSAGIDRACGDAVVLIDADLQDPPEVIAEMLAQWRAGWDVVYAQRTERPGETAFKRVTANLFYRVLNRLSDVDIPRDTGDFRLMNRRVVEALRQMPEQDRFLRGMVSWVGFRQKALPYRRAERFAGESKYPLRKMLALASDGLISFSLRPLRLATWLAGAALLAAVLNVVVGCLAPLATGTFHFGWTFGLSGLLLCSAAQLFTTGILGADIGSIYRHSQQRQLYPGGEELLPGSPTARTGGATEAQAEQSRAA